MILLTTIFISSLVIFGLDYCFYFELDEDKKPINKEILWFVRYYLKSLLFNTKLESLLKPLVDCKVCMSSFWGSIVFWILMPFTIGSMIVWPVSVIATAGLNRIINHFIE